MLQSLGSLLAQPFYGGIGSIFAFHRVVPEAARSVLGGNRALEITPEDLDSLLAELRRRKFDFVPMDDVPTRLRNSRHRFAAFTLDDGYVDNLEHALPIFRQHSVPFTVNVTRSFTEHTDSVWWFALEDVLVGRDTLTVDFGGRVEKLPLTNREERERAFAFLATWLRSCQLDELRGLLAAIFGPLGLDPLRATRALVLDTAGLKELARDPFVTLGAHTLHHLTSNLLTEPALRVEFSSSKQWVESIVGCEVRHLAYPFGGRNAVGLREFRIAKECGFLTAVTTRFANVFRGHTRLLHQLPRLEISGNYRTLPFLEQSLSGLLPARRNRWQRVVGE